LPPTHGFWDCSTTPTVSPRPPSSPKSVSSSLSSLISDVNDDLVVQGTFPSANDFIVRFAQRVENESFETSSGRRKASVKYSVVQSEWLILDHQNDYIRVHLAASFKFKGIWYGGVATMLGLEAVLQGSDCQIEWGDDEKQGWDIHGSLGYTSYSHVQENSTTSFPRMLQGSVDLLGNLERPASPMRVESTSSLLRAPLPQSNELADFSYDSASHDASPVGTPTKSITTTSGLGSHLPRSIGDDVLSTGPQPCTPFLLHLDMTEIRLSTNSNMECKIYGIFDIRVNADGRIVLPSFTFAKSTEHRSEVLIKSEVEGLEWYTDRALDPIPLVKGVSHRCPENTTLVTSKTQKSKVDIPNLTTPTPMASILAPSNPQVKAQTAGAELLSVVTFIPEVHIRITPLLSRYSPNVDNLSCAVKVRLNCLSQSSRGIARMVEFGLASASETKIPNIEVVSCTVGDHVVDVDILPGSESTGLIGRSKDPGQPSEWACWVGIPLDKQGPPVQANSCNGPIELLYLIGFSDNKPSGESRSSKSRANHIFPLLPCFPNKIGLLEVEVEDVLGLSKRLVLHQLTHISYTRLVFQDSEL
jgi:hypothetical protein